MYMLGFLVFFLLISWFVHMATNRGEVQFKCTKEELRKLGERGRMMGFIFWPFCALFLIGIFPNVPSRNVFSDLMLIIVAFPAGLFASFIVNSMLEKTRFRIQKSVPR